jgi:Novel STAND NTPase 1
MEIHKTAHWPEDPYRELDFYTAEDESLFCDRSAEVADCIQLFSQYQTKVLLLHGSSGSGKSSFLGAGLIPHLKRVADPPGYAFLREHDGVIRCTNDPVRVIAQRVLGAVAATATDTIVQSRPIRQLQESAPLLSDDVVASASSTSLVEPLLNTLSLLRLIVGKTVVLVVDQAEEVLTHSHSKDCTEAFFRFIEEVYLRDFDVRLIIALRTEYYGRFRNHLRIRDRYRALPVDCGLELYLLASLRDPEILTHALDWPASNGQRNYGFCFGPGALRTIVDDVLAVIPETASVTPALQVVCATLTRDRNLEHPITVTAGQYWALGGFGRIVDGFIDSAVIRAIRQPAHPLRSARAAIGVSDSLTDRWRSVLVEMVSEQGGGVVVAIPRSETDLIRAARSHGLTGKIASALRAMADGRGAILRLMGTEADPAYILKHDTLALRLARWNQQQVGVRRLRRKVIYAGCAGVAICVAAAGSFLAASFSSLSAHNASIRLRNNFAEHEPGGRAERSLMVLVANLAETRSRQGLADRLYRSPVHEESEAALRRTLLRTPWFHGRFAAAGMNTDGTELALLDRGQDTVRVLTFPDGIVDETPRDHFRLLRLSQPDEGSSGATEPPRKGQTSIPTVVGFVSGLGPTVVRDEQALHWVNQTANSYSLTPRVADLGDQGRLRYEIVGGAIHAMHRGQRREDSLVRIARLDRAALENNGPTKAPLLLEFRTTGFQQPGPLFDNTTSIGRHVRISETPAPPETDRSLPRDPTDNWSESPGRGEPCALTLSVRNASGHGIANIPAIQALTRQQEPNKPHLTMAFATGDEATLAFKSSGPSFYLRNFSSSSSRFGLPDDRPRRITLAADTLATEQDDRLLPAQWPVIHPLFAVARTKHGWRAAWMVGGGIRAVETDPDFDSDAHHDGKAHEIMSDVLITEQVGVRLTFSNGGRYLVLEQNIPEWRGVDVKIWDLGSARQELINARTTDETRLTRIACHAIRESGSSNTDQLKLFDIPAAFADPCAGVP